MSFEELIVRHASPTLADLKSASLVCLSMLDGNEGCKEELEGKGLSFLQLRNRKGCPLLLVYRKNRLKAALCNAAAATILKECGYDPEDLEGCLEMLRRRFLTESCPHEVGIFLGYPAEDVQGCIENSGRNAIFSGIWKVYSDPGRAREIIRRWTECRSRYIECFCNGTELTRLCIGPEEVI